MWGISVKCAVTAFLRGTALLCFLIATSAVRAEISLTSEEKAWLESHHKLSVGVMANWPPFDFVDANKDISGIGIALLQEIRNLINVNFHVTSDEWQTIYRAVQTRELDMLLDITPKPSREVDFNFTAPYLDIPHIIIANNTDKNYNNEDDLANKTIALEEGFGNVNYFRNNYPGTQIRLYPDTEQALEAVSRGEADAYAGNRVVALYLIDKLSLSNLRAHGRLRKSGSILAIGTRKDYPILRDILQKALNEIGSERIHEIRNKWIFFSGSPARIPSQETRKLKLDLPQQQWIQQHPRIRVGIDTGWPPLEYLNSQGEYQGLSSDFLKYFARQIGVKLDPPSSISWSEVLKGLQDKTIDLAPMLIQTPERERYLNFTDSYINLPVVIFNQRGHTLLGGLTDLLDKRVGLVQGYAIGEFIENDFPTINQVKYKDTLSGLNALATGKIDAFVDVLAVGAYLITANGMSNLQVAASTPYQHDFAIGVRKDWPELIPILNQTIRSLPVQVKNGFLKKWLAANIQHRVDYTLLYWVLGIAATVFLLMTIRARVMSRVNAQLQEGRERLELALEGANLGIFEMHFNKPQGMTIKWNDTFSKHHSMPAELTEITSKAEFYHFIREADRESTHAALIRTLKGTDKQLHVEYMTSIDQRWIAVSGRILERDPGSLALRLVGISQDITERKEAHAAILRSSEFKSQFLANMSHEIRTPLNAVVGLTYLLSRSGLSAKQSEYVKNLKKSSHNLLSLIDDILDFSKIEAGHLKIETVTFSLDELLNDLSNTTAMRLPQNGIEFLFDVASEIPDQLIGDPFRLSQILNNLINNAIKFTEQGHIILRVRVKERSEDQLRLEFSVSDTGIGIAKTKLNHLFEPFIQEDGSTTRKYGGTGLGLSISKHLSQLMGGNLQATSVKGEGSVFFFDLPFRLPAQPVKQVPGQRGINNLHNLKALLIDDNDLSLNVLRDTLESLKIKVEYASSGDEALEKIQSHPEAYDVVLVDWRMPDLDGAETIRRMHNLIPKSQWPLTIMMTAYGKDAMDHPFHDLELDGFLIKPITPSTLFNTIIGAKRSRDEHQEQTFTDLASETNEVPALQGKVILAEDNQINQQVINEILGNTGLEITLCDNGKQVLEQLQGETPDLILMDIQMPEMDGYETTQRIRNTPELKDIPIIAITANAMRDDISRSEAAGMQGHISKPVNPDELYKTLLRYLKSSDRPVCKTEPTVEEKQLVNWPDRIPGLDIKNGIKQVGGNEALYQKLLRDFLENHGHLGKSIRMYFQQGEKDLLSRAIHTIKGVSGNIGAYRMHDICSEIDHCIRADQGISANLIDEFSAACAELCAGIKDLISTGPRLGLTRSQQTVSAESLIQSLNECDASSKIQLMQSKEEISRQIGDEEFSEIQKLVEDYEYEQAAERLMMATRTSRE